MMFFTKGYFQTNEDFILVFSFFFPPSRWFWKVPCPELGGCCDSGDISLQYTSKIWFEERLNVFWLKLVVNAAESDSGSPHTTSHSPALSEILPGNCPQPKRTTRPSFLTAHSWGLDNLEPPWPTPLPHDRPSQLQRCLVRPHYMSASPSVNPVSSPFPTGVQTHKIH